MSGVHHNRKNLRPLSRLLAVPNRSHHDSTSRRPQGCRSHSIPAGISRERSSGSRFEDRDRGGEWLSVRVSLFSTATEPTLQERRGCAVGPYPALMPQEVVNLARKDELLDLDAPLPEFFDEARRFGEENVAVVLPWTSRTGDRQVSSENIGDEANARRASSGRFNGSSVLSKFGITVFQS
jgi:hypothetical protein